MTMGSKSRTKPSKHRRAFLHRESTLGQFMKATTTVVTTVVTATAVSTTSSDITCVSTSPSQSKQPSLQLQPPTTLNANSHFNSHSITCNNTEDVESSSVRSPSPTNHPCPAIDTFMFHLTLSNRRINHENFIAINV